MIARHRIALLAAAAAVLAMVACQKVPLLAPSGSTITLSSAATTLPVNGTTTIIANLIEASGTPPHSGTLVTFTTTLGSIEPAQARTDPNGQVFVTFHAGTSSGTAQITAVSGAANVGTNGAVKIAIGVAAVGRVNVSASPSSIPATGGQSTIIANVLDINGNPLPYAAVSFSTSAGNLADAQVTTDTNGAAKTILTTTTQATVTASVGATGGGGTTTPPTTPGTGTGGGTGGSTSGQASGTVTVTVLNAPTLVITPPTTQPTAGLPATFTFAVTAAAQNGSPIRDLSVNWGDGTTQDLGAVTGSAVVPHVFQSPGPYTIYATLTDASGNVVPVSSSVVVGARLQPAVSLALTSASTIPVAGTDTAFTASVAPAANSGTVIQGVTIDFGDSAGTTSLGAITGTSISLHHTYQTGGTFTATLKATDSNGGVGTAATSVFVQTATPLTVLLSATATPSGANTIEQFTATVVGLGNATVVNYHWVFGSTLGTADTSGNTVTRTYAAGTGSVTVSVTITTSTGAQVSGQTVIVVP